MASTRPLGLLDAATTAGLRPRGEDAVRYANGGAGYVLNEAAMRIVAGVDDAQGAADATVGLLAAVSRLPFLPILFVTATTLIIVAYCLDVLSTN